MEGLGCLDYGCFSSSGAPNMRPTRKEHPRRSPFEGAHREQLQLEKHQVSTPCTTHRRAMGLREVHL